MDDDLARAEPVIRSLDDLSDLLAPDAIVSALAVPNKKALFSRRSPPGWSRSTRS